MRSRADNLSRLMRLALLEGLGEGVTSAKGATRSSLLRRNLIRTNGSLTDSGHALALEHAPLQEQCHHLRLPLVKQPVPSTPPDPEAVALGLAKSQGWVGTHCEGATVHLLLKARMFDWLLANVSPPLGELVEPGLFHLDQLIEQYQREHCGEGPRAAYAPRNALYGPVDYERWEESLADLLALVWKKGWHTDLNVEIGMAIVHAMGFERWFALGELVCDRVYNNQNTWIGWPDLILAHPEDSQILAVEVKTSDRLHRSQIDVIPLLTERVGLPVEVWHLRTDAT